MSGGVLRIGADPHDPQADARGRTEPLLAPKECVCLIQGILLG